MAAKAWEQRIDESAQAFEAFTSYLAMPPAKRSTRAVGKKLGKSGGLIERWCTTHAWVSRARAWDNEVLREALAREQLEAVEYQRAMIKRHKEVGRKALEVALEMLTKRKSEITPAQLYQLMRGGQQLETSAIAAPVLKLAMSGDLVPLASEEPQPAEPGTQPEAPPQPQVLVPRIEMEIMGAALLSPDALRAEVSGWYDKPGEVD